MFSDQNLFSDPKFFLTQNELENDLWRDEIELLNLMLSKLPNAKVLLILEFDTEDQVLYPNFLLYFHQITLVFTNLKFELLYKA